MISEMHCSLVNSQTAGNEKQPPTVGEHLVLNCEGSWDRSFDFQKVQFVTDEKSKNIIKVFKVDTLSQNAFNVDMTLYAAGEVQFPDLQLTDGSAKISLGPQKFKINTVIEKTEDGKPPQPFGYIVSGLSWPWEYTAAAAGFLVLIVALAIFNILRQMRWNRLIDRLKDYESPLAPDAQFYKNIRQLEKNDYRLQDLEPVFKTYILRRYHVPIYQLNIKQVDLFLKNKLPRLKTQRSQILNLLKDLEVFKKQIPQETPQAQAASLEQRKKIIERFYRFVDQTEDAYKAGVLK